MSKEEIRIKLQNLVPRIEREFHANVEGFFGSRARGDERIDSDLDLLISFSDEADLYDLVGLGDFLEDVFRCKVDIISRRSLSSDLEPHVLDELVKL
jgi:uncharacterized protein